MKREEIIHMAITKDEMRDLISRMNEKMAADGKRYTTSTFLREFLLKPYLNGDSSPPQETVIETPNDETPEKANPWQDINF